MSKKILLLLMMILIFLLGNPLNGGAETGLTLSGNVDLSALQSKRIAVMPFLVGKLETPEKPVEKPLNQTLEQFNINAPNLAEGADRIMTRLVNDVMQFRFEDQMLSIEEAAVVYADVIRDQTLDTPRKLAKNLERTCKRILW